MEKDLVLSKIEYERGFEGLEALEAEVIELSEKELLRIEINEGLQDALNELQELESKLHKNQSESLFNLCKDNVIKTIEGQFGLASLVVTTQDGGNVNTTHNVRQGIYASEKERQAYENREAYDSDKYHSDSEYIRINKEQGELKKQGNLTDYMTGKKINPNDKTDLDHIVAAKTIHDDPARVLAGVDGVELANTESNLKMTDSSLNRSKKTQTAEEMLKKRDERLQKLDEAESKRGYLTESEQKEKAKLEKQQEINDEEFKKQYEEEKKKIDKKIDKAYYTSMKPYKEAIKAGAKDAAKMAAYKILGWILRELVTGLTKAVKYVIKKFGEISFREAFKRFKDEINEIWENIKAKWKDELKGAFGSGIMSFFSNFVVFIINTFFTTLKSLVKIINAGFGSLIQAIKTLAFPPENMTLDDAMYEASKILVTGIIGAISLTLTEGIQKLLLAIPGLNALMVFPIPIINESVGTILATTLSAMIGGILSTIAIYHMDKYRSKSKEDSVHFQIMAQHTTIAAYKTARAGLALADGYDLLGLAIEDSNKKMQKMKDEAESRSNQRKDSINKLSSKVDELENLINSTRKDK